MPFNWFEYLSLAQFLYDNADKLDEINKESVYRCVVSRAYFASYCHARNYAQKRFGFIPKELSDDHVAVKNEFKGRAFGDIPTLLDVLRQRRNECDYQDVVDNVSKIAQDAIDKAQKIFNRLNYTQPKN